VTLSITSFPTSLPTSRHDFCHCILRLELVGKFGFQRNPTLRTLANLEPWLLFAAHSTCPDCLAAMGCQAWATTRYRITKCVLRGRRLQTHLSTHQTTITITITITMQIHGFQPHPYTYSSHISIPSMSYTNPITKSSHAGFFINIIHLPGTVMISHLAAFDLQSCISPLLKAMPPHACPAQFTLPYTMPKSRTCRFWASFDGLGPASRYRYLLSFLSL
jgi:hypothetical protein